MCTDMVLVYTQGVLTMYLYPRCTSRVLFIPKVYWREYCLYPRCTDRLLVHTQALRVESGFPLNRETGKMAKRNSRQGKHREF